MERKVKNIVVVIAPYDKNMLKAIFNAMVIDLINIVVVGAKTQIVSLCQSIHLNANLLEIVDCSEEKNINNEVQKILNEQNVQGIVYGHYENLVAEKILKPEFEVEILNFTICKQLLFIANCYQGDNNKITDKKDFILETKKVMNDLMIYNHTIGLVTEDKNKVMEMEKKVLKKTLCNCKIDIISTKQIFKGKHNLIVFKNNDASTIFTETAKMSMQVKSIKIKKASNYYLVDAFEKDFKDIFFAFILLSKITLNKAEIKAQVS